MLGQFCGNLYKITNLVINLSNMGVQSRKATTWDPHYLGFHQARQDKIEYADAMLLMCPWCLYGFHSLAQELWRNISFVKHKTLITLIIELHVQLPKTHQYGVGLWKLVKNWVVSMAFCILHNYSDVAQHVYHASMS